MPPEQNQILVHLFEHLPVEESASTFEFAVAQSVRRFHAVSIPLLTSSGYPGCSLVATLATHTPHVFLAVTRQQVDGVVLSLANMEDYQFTSRGALFLHHVISLPAEDGSQSVMASSLLTQPSGYFETMPDHADIGGRHVHFWLAIALSDEEKAFRAGNGSVALMEDFRRSSRSPVVVA